MNDAHKERIILLLHEKRWNSNYTKLAKVLTPHYNVTHTKGDLKVRHPIVVLGNGCTD